MRLFEFNDYQLKVREEVWAFSVFKKILKRDKSRNKDMALKEMLFIYFYCDIESDYMIVNEEYRISEIKKDIELPEEWKIDSVMKEAMDFYESRSITILGKLCKNAMKAANDVSDYLAHTDVLLAERDDKGKPVHTLAGIMGGLDKVKKVMTDLKIAEKEVIKEKIDTENKMKGSQKFGMFENGL